MIGTRVSADEARRRLGEGRIIVACEVWDLDLGRAVALGFVKPRGARARAGLPVSLGRSDRLARGAQGPSSPQAFAAFTR